MVCLHEWASTGSVGRYPCKHSIWSCFVLVGYDEGLSGKDNAGLSFGRITEYMRFVSVQPTSR
jgi:hypothetical protein